MLASISAATVIEWQYYFAEHGFKHEMDNWRFASLAASNHNITAMAAGIKHFKPLSPSDFLPKNTVATEQSEDILMTMGELAGGTRFEHNS